MILPPFVELVYTLADIQQQTTASVLILTPCTTWLSMVWYKHPLTVKDLWDLNEVDKCSPIGNRFLREWKKEIAKTRLVNRILTVGDINGRAFGGTFFFAGFLKFLQDLLTFVSPQILRALIGFTANKSQPLWMGLSFAFIMFAAAFIQSCILHQYFHRCYVTGMRLRSAIIWATYRKALSLSNSARKKSTVGEIVNLMSVDAQRFMDMTTYLHTIWSAPLQIALAMYFLWQELGPSVLAGLGVLLLLVPFNAYISMKARNFQVKQMKFKDSRIKMMNEILNGVKVLKLYAWEKSFINKILGIREDELKQLLRSRLLNAIGFFAWSNAPFLVALATFATYVLSGNTLDASKAFVSISLFNILRFPIGMLPAVISSIIQASVSLQRLASFLKNEELDENNVEHSMPTKHEKQSVVIENGTFKWGVDEKQATLKNINFNVPTGSLIAVVGHVGSGKSSLVSAILGEMDKSEGNVYVKGSVAYVPQQAWMQNASIEDNILFGNDRLVGRYERSIEVCALTADLEMLPGGDQTEIGEKGINLSGGQKQRVSLARAVYSNSDVYILDDPLSAVDAHVGKHIFEQVIGHHGMLRHKTRIFVTHGVGFLPYVDKIVVLEDGDIVESGSFDELLSRRGAFADFLITYTNTEMNKPEEERIAEEELVNDELSQLPDEIRDRLKSISSQHGRSSSAGSRDSYERQRQVSFKDSLDVRSLSTVSERRSRVSTTQEDKDSILKQVKVISEKKKLIEEEKAAVGHVKLGVFIYYMKSMGWLATILILISRVAIEGCSVGSNVWLAEWSGIVNATDATRDLYLGVYGAIGASKAVVTLLSSLLLAFAAMHSARVLHSSMLFNVLKSPMSFFDTTPLGRIVNRFSKDIYVIDEIIPMIMNMFLGMVCSVISILVVICVSTPFFLIVIVPLAIVYILTQRFYVATSRQLKRLESISRSPIYSHFGESVQGVSTIRGYNVKDRFCLLNDRKVDANQMAYYPNISSNRWLAMRLEFTGNCIVLFASIFAVVGRNALPPGIVGLSISYAMQITGTLNWMVRMSSELESNIVAVERVKEYTEIEQEAQWEIEETKPDPKWPINGDVQFANYQTRYRAGLDLVLKGIDCDISAGEKIGIVGRTGAGKSSLTLALFRIIEAAEGTISIDKTDISKLGVHNLRSRITIIPQDPVLFSGTLRMNLDPFEGHSDQDLWVALENAHLKDFVQSLEKGLLHEISEGGENLSVGQRQLVCLARALLRKTQILVLDEATAAVDLETDDLIQATIRREFADCTILTIAHRLNTIMDSTRVMVLDKGRIAEFDPPPVLLSRKDSIFYSMAKDAKLVHD
ncbi:uncharacterized protein TRIADDRAFT_50946 [Trichoplax adhaerens]|uniref:Multidrug resistance-associated protein 1 n=1 Tax=Trichoplax adhaerens TaxID=10228 RepID=B3S9B6_TRIAD|nr:hypothetical protein TRIADDRAFT_50946 [Trichoplax adhaerens]EDV20619.1 hypothetical protein TRIADDRAFT_50946 [Trichoplax adhaerens]|eukprot:XP_002116819.1 hypothetical protein TRIADDRAFT_50946 [Trichoplax adhaerens]